MSRTGVAFDERQVTGDPGGARLADHPITRPAHIEEVDGEVHRDRRRPGLAARRPGQQAIQEGR